MARKPLKFAGWFFLAAILLAYGATALAKPGLAYQAMHRFLGMIEAIAPVLVTVFLLLFLTERLLTPGPTQAWLGRNSGLRGWLTALAAGILGTGPIYAWYALLAKLRAKGMRPALVAVVLYARAIKLPLLPLLSFYFGMTYAVILSLLIATFAILNGLAMELFDRTKEG
ncbi:MAG: hypothetical protein NHG36_18615 [Chromatiaceae bacterium]|nr:hypothetical protein [Candidatus Thioaporhodococcus sediminis]